MHCPTKSARSLQFLIIKTLKRFYTGSVNYVLCQTNGRVDLEPGYIFSTSRSSCLSRASYILIVLSPGVVLEERKEMSTYCLVTLWVCLVLCIIGAGIMFSIVYCKVTPTSWSCHWARVQYKSFAEYVGFIAYKLGKRMQA